MNEREQALEDALRCKRAYDAPTLRFKNEQLHFDESQDFYHVAVAGSNDVRDWIQNLTAWRWWKPGWIPSNWWHFHKEIPGTQWKATSGYVDAALNVVRELEPQITDKAKPICISGHSKGGPVAAIAAQILAVRGYTISKVRTFAAPRFSVQNIDTFVMNTSIQYIALGDVVPDYPKATAARDWRHQGRVVRIGSVVDDHIGVVRDGIKAHLIPNYISALKACLQGMTE